MFLAEYTGRLDLLRASARHDADTFRGFVRPATQRELTAGVR